MRYLALSLIALLLVSCFSEDLNYYRLHPQILRETLQRCPTTQPVTVSCDQLTKLARTMNRLARELQYDPQAFGLQVILLQNALVQQQTALKTNPQQNDLRRQIQQTKQEITDRQAVIRWLESPEK